jgi:hypothetical protein
MPRQYPVARTAGEPVQRVEPRLEQRARTPEFVHHEPRHQGLVFRGQQRDAAEERREHPTPVDVTDHHHRVPGVPGQPEVDEVAVAQIDLGGASGALAHHDVVLAAQLGERVERRLRENTARGRVVARVDEAGHLAAQYHLAGPVAARLEQHRIEPHAGLKPAGRRLQRLRPPDLAAVERDGRVVGHVLRLERRDPYPEPAQPPAQPGGEHALARIRGGTRDEQPALHRADLRRANGRVSA